MSAENYRNVFINVYKVGFIRFFIFRVVNPGARSGFILHSDRKSGTELLEFIHERSGRPARSDLRGPREMIKNLSTD